MSNFADEDMRTAHAQDFIFYWSARIRVAISAAKYRALDLKWLHLDSVTTKWVSDGVTRHEEYFGEWKACFISEMVQFEQFLGRTILYERFPQVPAWMRDASRLARRSILQVPKAQATILDITWPTDDPIYIQCSKFKTTEYLLNRWWEHDVPRHDQSITLSAGIKAFRKKIGKSWQPQLVARGEDQYLALSVVGAKTQLERTAVQLAEL